MIVVCGSVVGSENIYETAKVPHIWFAGAAADAAGAAADAAGAAADAAAAAAAAGNKLRGRAPPPKQLGKRAECSNAAAS